MIYLYLIINTRIYKTVQFCRTCEYWYSSHIDWISRFGLSMKLDINALNVIDTNWNFHCGFPMKFDIEIYFTLNMCEINMVLPYFELIYFKPYYNCSIVLIAHKIIYYKRAFEKNWTQKSSTGIKIKPYYELLSTPV